MRVCARVFVRGHVSWNSVSEIGCDIECRNTIFVFVFLPMHPEVPLSKWSQCWMWIARPTIEGVKIEGVKIEGVKIEGVKIESVRVRMVTVLDVDCNPCKTWL